MVRIHPTAIVEDGVSIGDGTSVWDNVHVRRGAQIGAQCIVGEKSYVAYDVRIGDRVKINAFVYVCAAVTIEDGVMLSAGTVFTNDRFPRATGDDLTTPRTSDPDEHTLSTLVKAGATIGAHATIGPGLTIGRWAMVGMGSVVTRDVEDHHLVMGNPARSVGAVCSCGEPMVRWGDVDGALALKLSCTRCGLAYSIHEGRVAQLIEAA